MTPDATLTANALKAWRFLTGGEASKVSAT